MKLFTHNMLTSKCLKGVLKGYPLGINATDVKVLDVQFNPEFICKTIPKVDWPALYAAADSLGHSADLPQEVPSDYERDADFLKKAHRALLELDVVTGELVCPETGRKFPISDGIPNMLLTETEVEF